jgi:hypothetical protein
MTGAALRIATALAGSISYDGKHRGAPRGYAAFTMPELAELTGLSARSVRYALAELAKIFGLTIEHCGSYDRHLFTFTKVYDADEIAVSDEDLTPAKTAEIAHEKRASGNPLPPSLYTETKSNNDTTSIIQILNGAGSVYQTPFAAIIEDAKKGTEAAGMDTQFLWKGFHMLNARNDRSIAPLSWLVAFVRKAKPTFQHKPKAPAPAAESIVAFNIGPLLKSLPCISFSAGAGAAQNSDDKDDKSPPPLPLLEVAPLPLLLLSLLLPLLSQVCCRARNCKAQLLPYLVGGNGSP